MSASAVGKRVRRSLHFVPGGQRKFLDKAIASGADTIIIDLEDAVTPERKDAARLEVRGWLEQVDFRGKEVCIRMNDVDTPYWEADLEGTMIPNKSGAAGQAPPHIFMVPKAETGEGMQKIAKKLDQIEQATGRAPGSTGLLPICSENPGALLNIKEVAASTSRIVGLTWGVEDFSVALGARRNRRESGEFLEVFRFARLQALLAAKANKLDVFDTVWTDLKDLKGLRQECDEAADSGYDGKLTIHPDQIDVVNAAFSPSAEEAAEAAELLAAFEQQKGQGAIQFKGKMMDIPHATRARSILEKARQAGIGTPAKL